MAQLGLSLKDNILNFLSWNIDLLLSIKTCRPWIFLEQLQLMGQLLMLLSKPGFRILLWGKIYCLDNLTTKIGTYFVPNNDTAKFRTFTRTDSDQYFVDYTIMSTSVTSNVLRLIVGNLFACRYNKAVDICCLKPDLTVLPAGDETEVSNSNLASELLSRQNWFFFEKLCQNICLSTNLYDHHPC